MLRRRIPFTAQLAIAGGLGAAAIAGLSGAGGTINVANIIPSSTSCEVKGNVSIGSGERIYHVPGQRYYEETVIRPEYGERWFCSEQEARQAGWRKSGV